MECDGGFLPGYPGWTGIDYSGAGTRDANEDGRECRGRSKWGECRMKVAVVGATGLVGQEMMKILEERIGAGMRSFTPYASDSSAGRLVRFMGRDLEVLPAGSAGVESGTFVLGATSAEAAESWVPTFVGAGAIVIDNSSRFRMEPSVPLVVPEVNMGSVPGGCRLIANPNCSTIQLVMVLATLDRLFGVEWVSVSTYQSVSGGGTPALEELERQRAGVSDPGPASVYNGNVVTSVGPVDGLGYCEEETKLMRETCRIIGRRFPVFASCARVPVRVGHVEAVTIAFSGPVRASAVSEALSRSRGVAVHPSGASPLEVAGTDEVVAGRVRNHPDDPRLVQLWITADNVRKGAALNAVQILEALAQRPSPPSHCSPPVEKLT